MQYWSVYHKLKRLPPWLSTGFCQPDNVHSVSTLWQLGRFSWTLLVSCTEMASRT